MDKPTHLIEFETMILGRHLRLNSPRPRRSTGHLDTSAYILLSRLSMEGPLSIGQLSDALGLDTSTLHRQTTAILGGGRTAGGRGGHGLRRSGPARIVDYPGGLPGNRHVMPREVPLGRLPRKPAGPADKGTGG